MSTVEAPNIRADEILSLPTNNWDAAAPADEAPFSAER
jgi:hypothetical protein